MIHPPLVSLLSTVSCISVLAIMVEFKAPLKQVMIKITLGSVVLVLVQVWATTAFGSLWRQEVFLMTVLLPIYLLFLSFSRVKGFRFAYTFILAMSVMVGINTITITLYTLSHHLILAVSSGLFVLILCSMALVKYYRPLYQEVQALKQTDWSGFCITPLLSLCLLYLLSEEPLSMIFTLPYLEHELLAYAILFVNHVLIYMNLRKFLVMTTLKKEASLREVMLNGLRADLSAQKETIQAMKLIRHDLRHHLQLLTLAQQSKSLLVEGHVEKLMQQLDETVLETYCKNYSVNAILSSYFNQARCEKIPITHRIHCPQELPIEAIDLSLILANGIENAIHANQKVEEANRYLEVTIDHQPHRLTILIENPVNGLTMFSDSLPISTHIDHGLGSLSISRLAKQAQGNAYFSQEKGRFTLIVHLPL